MIEAKLVFRDAAGNICPPGHVNSLEPEKFYTEWATGKLRRDVVVHLDNPAAVEKGLRNTSSPEFQLVGGESYWAWSKLDGFLSLVPRFLSLHDDSETQGHLATMIDDSLPSVSMFAPEVQQVKRATYRNNKLYTTYYDLTASVAHTDDWYDRDPEEVVRDIILELLEKWTVRDNATLLYLLNTSCGLINDVCVTQAKFTPVMFSTMRDLLWRWQLATPHCVATAQAISRIDFEEWSGFASFVNQPEPDSLHTEHGRLMDTALFCVGAPHDVTYPDYGDDQKGIFLCGSPDVLGVRSVLVRPRAEVVNHSIVGAPVHGWAWYTHIGTQITNSRAVVAGVLEGS